MKFFYLFLVIASVGNAQAERFIVKNPRASLEQFGALKTIEIGGDRYMVVNPPPFVTFTELRSYGEAAFLDAHITLPRDVPVDEVADPSDDPDAKIAWHVKALQYEKLPAEYNGAGVIVAVVDTGVDYTHPALADHMWTNEKEIPGNGIDDDGNGYIDDIHGWDFEHAKSDPMDDNGHGTHCSGIIAASPNAETRAQGVAPGAKVMAIRVIGENSFGFLSDVIAGIKYAVDNGAKVLSNSWRIYKSWGDFDPSDQNIELLKQAIVYAGEHGAVFVAAAGNESLNLDTDFDKDPMFPAGYTGISNLLVVAASDKQNEPAYFTNYGVNYVNVAAPGVSILSTVPGNNWSAMSGTSMATPLVAGAVARGLSARFAAAEIGDRLVNSSSNGASWGTKIRAKGVVDLVRYLTP